MRISFQFSAQANRTLSVIVNATDDSHNLSESKAAPVIGMWALADPGHFAGAREYAVGI